MHVFVRLNVSVCTSPCVDDVSLKKYRWIFYKYTSGKSLIGYKTAIVLIKQQYKLPRKQLNLALSKIQHSTKRNQYEITI